LNVSADDYIYLADTIDVQGDLPREFEWVNTSGYSSTEDLLDTRWVVPDILYTAAIDVDFPETFSFAPLYEIDNFGLDGVVSYSDMPTLEEGASYDFISGEVKKNGSAVVVGVSIPVTYYVDDANFTFGKGACGSTGFVIPWGLAGGSLGSASAELADIQLCDVDGDSELSSEAAATAMTAFNVNFVVGKQVTYLSEYFELADRSAGVQEPRVWVEGTVSGLYSNDDEVTTVGNLDRIEIRNKVFKEVSKVTNGVYEIAGDGSVNLDGWYISQGKSLSSDDVAYFFGDGDDFIKINGTTMDGDFHKTIVVVGADAYVGSEVVRGEDGGELGIIVLEDEAGNGGDLYVDPAVGDLHANIFLDGSLYRGDESGAVIQNEAYDGSDLSDQFFIWGSLVSENTVGGYEEGCTMGDGTEGGDCLASMQQDLAYTSYFEVCYPLVEGTDDFEICPGYEQSEYDGDYWIHPVIIEYRPSEELPLFNSQ